MKTKMVLGEAACHSRSPYFPGMPVRWATSQQQIAGPTQTTSVRLSKKGTKNSKYQARLGNTDRTRPW